MEFVSCNFCQSINYEIVCTGKDFLIGSNTQFNVVRCKNCGLLYTNPRPKPATISKYYPESYSNFLLSNRFFSLLRHVVFGNELNLFSNIVKKNSRVLEIGCGTGEYLSYLKHKGYEVEGIELSKYCIDTAWNKYGLNIKQGTIFDYKNKENYFDLIIMRHVLEHVPDPLETIKAIYKMLKENGTFFCLIPNAASYDAKIFKQYWRGFELPRHYFHYDPKVLKKIFEQEGFHNIKFFYSMVPINWIGSIAFYLKDKKLPKIFRDFFHDCNPLLLALFTPVEVTQSLLKKSGRIKVLARTRKG